MPRRFGENTMGFIYFFPFPVTCHEDINFFHNVWMGISWEKKIKKIAAPEFRVWSPTTLLGQALTSLTTVDRTGNGAFW